MVSEERGSSLIVIACLQLHSILGKERTLPFLFEERLVALLGLKGSGSGFRCVGFQSALFSRVIHIGAIELTFRLQTSPGV